MKQAPRGLNPEEAALWRRVAATVTPIHPRPIAVPASPPALEASPPPPPPKRIKGRVPPPIPLLIPVPTPMAVPKRPLTTNGLDSTWDRKLTHGSVAPDVTIDLHGMTLAIAHHRLNGGIAQALAMGARVILLIAGKHRPHGEHDLRGERRGAIRAKLLDWLAASPHAGRIAAVRAAQPRHGGDGAVYIVLRKAR